MKLRQLRDDNANASNSQGWRVHEIAKAALEEE